METTITDAPAPRLAKRNASRVRALGSHDLAMLGAVLALVLGVGWVATRGWYSPGSDLGYWLGVAGGGLMLLLLLYPMRKRLRSMRWLGHPRIWFTLHMVCGIAGPCLILLHSTFHFGSINATVAFASMAVVAGSGLLGRFLYARIHHGLYGEKASLADLRARAGFASEEARSKLHFAPEAEDWLVTFEAKADAAAELRTPLVLLTLGSRAFLLEHRCRREISERLAVMAAARGWPPAKRQQRERRAWALTRAYLRTTVRAAQFGLFERLFRLWHVAHVPLVYTLVVSAIAHVIAVHMY